MQGASVAFATEVTGNDLCVAAEIDITFPVYRINLCANPGFESGVSLWVAAGGTILVQLPAGTFGNHSLLAEWLNSATAGVCTASYTFPTQVGSVYTVSAYVSNNGSVQTKMAVGASSVVQTSSGRISLTVTATATNTTVVFSNNTTVPSSGTNGAVVDGVLIEQSGALGLYFDGDTNGGSWIGPLPHLGQSKLPINPFTATRVNLCTNPSFEDPAGTTNWAVGGTVPPSLATISPAGWSGTKAMQVTWGTAGSLPLFATNIATVNGQVYTASLYVMVPAGASPFVLLSVNGAFGSANTTRGVWQRISITFTATGATTSLQIWPTTAPAAGNTVQVDACLVEQSTTVGVYFDGSVGAAGWNGSSFLSTSTMYEVATPDVTLMVESVEVERQMTTDMPDGTRLISGYPSASATVTMSGLYDTTDETKSAAQLFNRNDPSSPLYRTDAGQAAIVVRAGLDTTGNTPELLGQFVGVIDDYEYEVSTGVVTVSCLDKRQTMRTSPSVVPVTNPYPCLNSATNNLPAANDIGLTSLYAIDSLLRSNGINACPPPRSNCILYASMQGSVFPQIWDTTSNISSPYVGNITLALQAPLDSSVGPVEFILDNGHYSNQLPQDFTIIAPVAGNSLLSAGGNWYYEFSMAAFGKYTDQFGDGELPSLTALSQAIDSSSNTLYSQPTFSLTTVSNTPALGASWLFTSCGGSETVLNVTAGWHRVGVQIGVDSNTNISTKVYIDGVLVLTISGEGYSGPVTQQIFNQATVYGCSVDALQISLEQSAAPLTGFTPTAFLDYSLNPLTAIPDLSAADPWTSLQGACEAELAIGGFDELGTFRFKNRVTLTSGAPVRTISAETSLKDIAPDTPMSAYANHVTAVVNALTIGNVGTSIQAIWSADSTSVYTLPSGTGSTANDQVFTNVVETSEPCVISQIVSLTCPDIGEGGYFSGLRACTTSDGTGTPVTTGISMTVQQLSPTSIQFKLQNTNSFPVYLVTPTGGGYDPTEIGQPFLAIAGWAITAVPSVPLTLPIGVNASTGLPNAVPATTSGTVDAQWPTVAYGGATSNIRGEVLLALSSNSWLQDYSSGQDLVEAVLEDLVYPRYLVSEVPIVADPRLQLTDRITAVESELSHLNDDAVIIGSTLTISKADWTQSLNLRMVAVPGYWTLGVAGKSEMGATTWI